MNLESLLADRRRAVVVAHPDDETLWAGGLIASYPGDWTIICCSIPRLDPLRAWKFFDACKALAAKGRLMPFEENDPTNHAGNLQFIKLKEFDVVVTHGPDGEYGHRHHKDVNRWVMKNFDGPVITFFGSEKLQLDAHTTEIKWLALQCYDHVLPYSPLGLVPKWQALAHRYAEHLDGVETFNVHNT